MYARFRSESHSHAQVASTLTVILLWRLHKSQGCFSECFVTSPAKGICHRPWRMTTGLWLRYWPRMDGPSALHMAGRPNLPTETCLTAAEGKQGMAMHFQSNVYTTTLLFMFMTQRGMVFNSRTTNRVFQCVMAQRVKVCNFNMEWNAQNKQWAPTSIIINSRGKRCMLNVMQPRHGS